MSKGSHMTIKVYNAVKVMLESDASYKEIADFLKLSSATVSRIDKSKDFDEYKHNVNAYYFMQKQKAQEKAAKAKQQEKKEEPKPKAEKEPEVPLVFEPITMKGGTMSSSYQFNRLYEVLKSMDATMKIISNKLGAIVDELID